MNLCMKDIQACRVPSGHLTVWWLGQASFLVKSSEGVIVAIDPYLSNSCKASGEAMGLDCDRIMEPLLSPAELCGVDLIVFTHSHLDHFDPDTILPYREAGGAGPYVAPAETAEKLREMGIEEDEIIMIWPNKTHRIRDLRVRATLAIPFGGDDLTHVGYLIAVENGPTFYFTGDTDYHDVLGISVSPHNPDVMLTVINGAFRNMSAAEAARLASQINPKVVIPCHYDLFPDNSADPRNLRTNLFLYDMHDRYRVLESGKPYTYPET